MFLVSKTLIALLIESARAEASDNSLEVIVPLESDLRLCKLLEIFLLHHYGIMFHVSYTHLSNSSSRRAIFLLRAWISPSATA